MVGLLNVPRKVFMFGILLAFATLYSIIVVMPNHVNAQTAPTLGTAASFAVLGGSTVTNTGPTVINGNVGVAPGSAIVGFPPGIVTPPGTLYPGDATALQAQTDTTAAYNSLAGQPCDVNLTDQDLGGMTLTTGVYCFNTSAQLTGTLTLDAEGSNDAVFIFQIGSTLTTATNSSVNVVNGGNICNVWWQVASSATLGTTTSFGGNILAQASITLVTGATLSGRALAQTGAVTMDSNVIGLTNCNVQLPINTPSPTNTLEASATATNTPGVGATATYTPGVGATATNTPGVGATATYTPGVGATATYTPGVGATATNIPGVGATATNIPGVGATTIPGATIMPNSVGAAAAGISGLPNTGGGPPQATYWLGR